MPFPEHEVAARAFGIYVNQKIDIMDLDDELDDLGSTTLRFGSFSKEADGCWAPALQSTNPTLVLEIGLSESSRQLAIDAQGWLESRGSTVKLAVIMKINRDDPEIVVRRWELRPRQSSIRTRASPLSASCTQEVRMFRSNNTTMVTGDMILPFQKVVGRLVDPNNPQEQDFTITQQKFQKLAEKVWRKQRFI
jgi:hypothetical protein